MFNTLENRATQGQTGPARDLVCREKAVVEKTFDLFLKTYEPKYHPLPTERS